MIERLYFRDLVTFDEVELEFEKGLVVFSGPSGAGKSVLISAILSTFGCPVKGAAAVCEVRLKRPKYLKHEAYVFEDELNIKTLKKEKLRYFIDEQSISKKVLTEIFSPYVNYLSVRDRSGFESEALLSMIDRALIEKDKTFKKSLKEYQKRYANYKAKMQQLHKIREEESRLAELIEFAKYEIEKINAINPQEDEEKNLLKVKQQLSRIDKIKDVMQSASEVFAVESAVEEVYRLLEKDVSFFSETMNLLRSDFEEASSLTDELEELNVEEILNRLSELSTLKNRYGSIEEALLYRDKKEKELAIYTHREQDKSMLESFLQIEERELQVISSRLSLSRQKEAKALESGIKTYLENLKLPALQFEFTPKTFTETGLDLVDVKLGSSKTETLSGGEFNRLRLALMAASIPKTTDTQGVLILDEIDANVSGDESIAIAEMISTLSKAYQIFAISHQPHLAAKAAQHIVVTKSETKSEAEVLDEKGRVQEITRIVAGEKPTSQALAFAKELRGMED